MSKNQLILTAAMSKYLKTNVVSIKKNGIVSTMNLSEYQSHKKLFELKLVSEGVSMQQLFSKLLEKFHNDPVHGGHTGQKRLYAIYCEKLSVI